MTCCAGSVSWQWKKQADRLQQQQAKLGEHGPSALGVGVVEGHVSRIKMLKRQRFGRAGFVLLRKRVRLAH